MEPPSIQVQDLCEDGRYYLEQEFGNEYGAFPGVVKSREDLTTEPTFYTSLEAAARAAFALIKQVYRKRHARHL